MDNIEIPAVGEGSSENPTCFMYLLMDALMTAMDTATNMQITSAESTGQVSDSFATMLEKDNDALEAKANQLTAELNHDKPDNDKVQILQTEYSQMSQEIASKETIMTGTLEVTQQTTAQYSSTLQQLVQTGGVVNQICGSVAQMIERGYS